ncbi:MAG: hypothetical protein KDJ86_01720 [Bauldia sp.]|uniref:hypothetical protein n=1 Tax=Bauldia sp. TaxID=2575872 RepID=UPI001D6D3990|nr:hypothetical protein [Bauldia sp.]MCB1494477.1 hypothetical protein [Bauldia sp.]
MAAAIHAVGHLARRFGAVDAALLDRVVTAASGFGRSRRVAGALYDMRDDIGHFIPESPPAVPSVRDGTCRDGPG